MNRYWVLVNIFVACLAGGLIWSANHYNSKYQEARRKVEELQATNGQLTGQLDWQNSTQRAVSSIDENRTQELNDAKNQIDDLQRLVASGARKLQLAATCPASRTSGMVDASSPRLTDAAERDYFRLRERIETARGQIAGLQDYIRNVCLR